MGESASVDGGSVEVKAIPAPVRAPAKPSAADLEVRMRRRFPHPEGSFHLNVHFRANAGFHDPFWSFGRGENDACWIALRGWAIPMKGASRIDGDDLFDSEAQAECTGLEAPHRLRDPGSRALPSPDRRGKRRVRAARAPGCRTPHAQREILSAFRIEHLRTRRPAQISGGERQRVALARTLVTEPRALLLDEPLAALDRPTKSRLLDDLREWNRAHRVPILYVTHSAEEVFALGEQVIVLEAGRIVAQGSPHEVMRAPRWKRSRNSSGSKTSWTRP